MSAGLLRRVGVFEGLEPRQVLTGGPAGGVVELGEGGVLHVTGTNKNDKIAVWLEGEQLEEQRLKVVVNKATHFFSLADVEGLAIDAGGGHDVVKIAYTVVVDAWISGGNGHDQLQGGGGDDDLFGDAGHDKLGGGLGNDSIHGGAGHDLLNGNEGDDELFGEWGHDKLLGGAGRDWLSGGAGHDDLCGQADGDWLYGDDGHDKLSGGWGEDELYGGNGNDQLNGNEDDDWLEGEAGHDKLQGAAGNDKLKGCLGNDHLDGGAGENLLDGDEGTNKLKNGTECDFDAQEPLLLVAFFSGPGISVTAEYEVGEPTVLFIRVSGDLQGTFNVTIGGVTIGQITKVSMTPATLRFSSDPEDGELSLPDVEIVEGTPIVVGPVEGTFGLPVE